MPSWQKCHTEHKLWKPDQKLAKLSVLFEQVMEEIIAKSKAGKAEKRMAREDDLDETMALDKQLKELMAGGGLAPLMRPSGRRGAGPAAAVAVGEDDAAFDRIRRELVHDRRGTVCARFFYIKCKTLRRWVAGTRARALVLGGEGAAVGG